MGACGCLGNDSNTRSQARRTDLMIVGTLNYSAVLQSPFEFKTLRIKEDVAKLSFGYKSLFPLYYPNTDFSSFQWPCRHL